MLSLKRNGQSHSYRAEALSKGKLPRQPENYRQTFPSWKQLTSAPSPLQPPTTLQPPTQLNVPSAPSPLQPPTQLNVPSAPSPLQPPTQLNVPSSPSPLQPPTTLKPPTQLNVPSSPSPLQPPTTLQPPTQLNVLQWIHDEVLPPQLIYQGKTVGCHPRITFMECDAEWQPLEYWSDYDRISGESDHPVCCWNSKGAWSSWWLPCISHFWCFFCPSLQQRYRKAGWLH